jgi:hypothetical protein
MRRILSSLPLLLIAGLFGYIIGRAQRAIVIDISRDDDFDDDLEDDDFEDDDFVDDDENLGPLDFFFAPSMN